MNILLANMPITFNKRDNLEPPLGICYIASMLKRIEGVGVFLKDYELTHFSKESLRKYLQENSINIIGVSCRTASYKSAKEFIRCAREIDSGIYIVSGGHHVTAFPWESLVDVGCDAVIRGEGEYAFKELVEALIQKNALERIEGITYRKNESEVVENNARPPINDIDALPWPDRTLLDLTQYNVITLLTSRGCPFNCIYCDKGISTRTVKYRSAQDIFREMKHIANDLGKRRLYIVDDHFFLKRKRLEPILDMMIEEKLPVTWTCQARVDGISMDILEKAKKAGCEQIMYGIETGDETELKYIRKGASLEEAEKTVGMTRAAGITARVNFMLGFPISTRQTMKNTITFGKKIKPDIVRFFAVSPLPNTDLWDDIYGKGRIPEGVRWDEMDFFKPSFDIKAVPRDEVSLYVSAGYWHVLKKDFILEITIGLVPGLFRLLWLTVKTGRIRGNISKCFPRSVNLLIDNMHQLSNKGAGEIIRFMKSVIALEKTI